MDKSQVTIALSFLVLFLGIIWVISRGKKISRFQKIDNDLNITKNRLNWWRDKNIK